MNVPEDWEQELERRDQEAHAAVRKMVADQRGEDAAREFDARMKEIRLGVSHAPMVWHSISQAQRTALLFAERWGGLSRHSIKPSEYHGASGQKPDNPIRVKSVRALLDHELVECVGGAFEPERRVSVTERGRFIIRYGSHHSCPTCK